MDFNFEDKTAVDQEVIAKIGIDTWSAIKLAQFKESVAAIKLLYAIQQGLPLDVAIAAIEQSLEHQELEFIAAGADPALLDLVRQ